MRNKAIALIAIPAMILMGSLNAVNADDNNGQLKTDGQKQHQEGRDKHHGPNLEKKLKKLSKKLALTDDQTAQMKTLFEKQTAARKAGSENRKSLYQAIRVLDVNAADYADKLTALKQQAGLQAQGKIDTMIAAQQGMKAILTPEQFTKFEEMKKKRGGKRGKHGNRDQD